MSSKKTGKINENKIFIDRILIDPRDGFCFVVEDNPQTGSFMNRYNVRIVSDGNPTKLFFNVKDDEKMWIKINPNTPNAILEIGLRSPKDIEFFQKK